MSGGDVYHILIALRLSGWPRDSSEAIERDPCRGMTGRARRTRADPILAVKPQSIRVVQVHMELLWSSHTIDWERAPLGNSGAFLSQ